MERRALLLIAIFAVALSSSSVAIRADQTVWSGIIIASNSGPPEPTPTELTPVEATLRQLFGYTRVQRIGEARKTLKSGQEDLLATTKYFALRVDARRPKAGGYVLNLRILQETRVLLDTNAQRT